MPKVLNGFNCTIFAYGQTGTGKTYTMTGDISNTLPLPDNAGIIPRVLYGLFHKLDQLKEMNEEAENSVKCSFIELYNEELRDLLSADENVKLKIFDDNSNKRGQGTSTLVQGMEESHIKSATKGIDLLRAGSHKRQVAATKCNDLSSRSHTVFTITVYMKRIAENGEDYVSAGKLNLVDLAGSENIQRSGAENKRATEAGLINKSLLTLGRVINALVDKGSHIPYRESKLTRLLQDSLGGRTKTCIIATLSPAKSNLEETISTLDYAFRAKNIRNKPQVNQMVSKKTLLREFTSEIEQLKSELIATRQRNGVYLTQETYDQITTESESRRILSEEQRDRLELMEANLHNKIQELFSLTSNFHSLKKNHENTRTVLEGTTSLLEKTEAVLEHTRSSLSEETMLKEAHMENEDKLVDIGHNLISTLGKTTSDIGGLYSKLRRRSDLQTVNRRNWTASQATVTSMTRLVENRMDGLRAQQDALMTSLSTRMQSFVQDELQKLEASQSFLQEKMRAFESSEKEVNAQTAKSRDDMNEVLEEIKTLREDVKTKVGQGLEELNHAAQRISLGIITELDAFQAQLHASFASLGRDFKGTFDDLVKSLNEQQADADRLRQQIVKANADLVATGNTSQTKLRDALASEKRKAAEEREILLAKMTALVTSNAEVQEMRWQQSIDDVCVSIDSAKTTHKLSEENYGAGMDSWMMQSSDLVGKICKSRESVKTKLKTDFATANEATTSLRSTTTAVHSTAVKIVDEQMAHMDTQLHSLDDILARVRAQNEDHHAAHVRSIASLASNVQDSYTGIGGQFATTFSRVEELGHDLDEHTRHLRDTLPDLEPESELRRPLSDLREQIDGQNLAEYQITGQTPAKVLYEFPMSLPRTADHEKLLRRFRGELSPVKTSPVKLVAELDIMRSPSKAQIFTDSPAEIPLPPSPSRARSTTGGSLRELDVNALPLTIPSVESALISAEEKVVPPPLKRQNTNPSNGALGESLSKLPARRTRKTVANLGVAPDRENVNFSASVGPGTGRRLRSNGSS